MRHTRLKRVMLPDRMILLPRKIPPGRCDALDPTCPLGLFYPAMCVNQDFRNLGDPSLALGVGFGSLKWAQNPGLIFLVARLGHLGGPAEPRLGFIEILAQK